MIRVHIRWERRPSQASAEELRRVVRDSLERLQVADAEVHLVVTGDDRLRDLNRRFRSIDSATDVLSFPDGDLLPSGLRLLGEIVVSVDSARRQALDRAHGELRELGELVLHGMLHLLGYDHERDHGAMNRLELRLREEIWA